MIGKILSFMILVGVVATDNSTTTNTNTTSTTKTDDQCDFFKPYDGIDPNTLSCDLEGHIFMLLPHFTNCAKFFMCAYGEEVEFECSGGKIFHFEYQICNWETLVTCSLRVPKEDIDTEGSGFSAGDEGIGIFGEEIENGPIEVLTADAAGTVRPNGPVSNRFMTHDLNCHRADSAARQVAYKGDCQRYWRCVAGVPQVMYCSDGLFFNELAQQCDHEANSKCVVQTVDELQGEFIVYKN